MPVLVKRKSGNFDEIFKTKAKLQKEFEREIFISSLPAYLLLTDCKFTLNS